MHNEKPIMLEKFAKDLIEINHYLHEAQIGFLNKDVNYLANQIKTVSMLAGDLAHNAITTCDASINSNKISDPPITPNNICNPNNNCCGGICSPQPQSQPQIRTDISNKTPNSLVHPGFAIFSSRSSSQGTNNWNEVVSSNIKAISYNTDNNILLVRFVDDSVYEYNGVSSTIYKAFLLAPSKGKFFHHNIRLVFPSKRIA